MKNYQPTIALAMIVKGTSDEAASLDKCLESINGYVDAIYLNLNFAPGKEVAKEVIEVAKRYKAVVFKTVWVDNFVKARAFIFSQVPKKYDWVMWLDADDTIENPEKIRDVIAIAGKEIRGIHIQYDYAHDEYGNCTTTLQPCRLCRNDGSYFWESSVLDDTVAVHETLVPSYTVGKARNNEFKVIHHSNGERRAKSLKRNIRLLEGMYDRQVENGKLDPRTVYYLATHYYDANRYPEVQQLLMEYLKVSGWAEERSEAWVYLGLTYLRDRPDAARQSFLHAIGENPRNPRPYVELGELEFLEKRYVMSEDWLLMAINKREQETAYVILPMENKYRAYMLLAQTYLNMGFAKVKAARKYVDMALELRPTDPLAKETQELVSKLIKVRERTQAVLRLARMLEDNKETDRVIPFLDLLSDEMQDNPAVVGLRQRFQKPHKWPKNSIAIVCSDGPLGMWGPWSLKEGIGGSEEAVIRLAQELVKQEWEVTVYGTPGAKAGEYDGVIYKQFWELNFEDEFDVLIGWRNPALFDSKFKTRKSYLWVHDALDPREFTQERLDNIDKVILLSEYHRTLFPAIPNNKIFLSSNGITPKEFQIKPQGRDPHRIIYMSSHVRGLELLYGMWPRVKKAVPDATLDIYYGWESFIAIHSENSERMDWMQYMQKTGAELEGVTDHGKIPQPQIVEEIFKSGVWAYPCPFPEISCITAMKAQAGGSVPVSSDFAALSETVQWGTKVHMTQKDPKVPVGKWDKKETAKFEDALIDMLSNPKKQESIRAEMMKWSRKNQSWQGVAEQWGKEMR
jgi:glycosyltransferase involved in cell wall biosynthesis